MSNVPNDMHHALVALYMSSVAHPYPRDALLSKVELVVSFVSSRIGRASEDGYEKDWAVRAGAKTGALLCQSPLDSGPTESSTAKIRSQSLQTQINLAYLYHLSTVRSSTCSARRPWLKAFCDGSLAMGQSPLSSRRTGTLIR